MSLSTRAVALQGIGVPTISFLVAVQGLFGIASAPSVTSTHYGAVPRRRLDRNKEIMLMLTAVLPILDD